MEIHGKIMDGIGDVKWKVFGLQSLVVSRFWSVCLLELFALDF